VVLKQFLPLLHTRTKLLSRSTQTNIPVGTGANHCALLPEYQTYLVSMDYNPSSNEPACGQIRKTDPQLDSTQGRWRHCRPSLSAVYDVEAALLSEIHNFTPTLLNEFRSVQPLQRQSSRRRFLIPRMDSFPTW